MRLAVWTLANLDEASRNWAYEVDDTAEHAALGQSRRAARLQAVDRVGAVRRSCTGLGTA